MSLNGALATASRSLELYSLGIQVSGNNIANASTPGYVRDQLRLQTTAPYFSNGSLVGGGAGSGGVKQVLDRYLETRIHTANTEYSASAARTNTYAQLQTALGELGDHDLSSSLNNFVAAIQNAANQPDDPAIRNIVIQQGKLFAQDASNLRGSISELRTAQSNQLRSLVDEANTLISTIESLNPQIGQLEANGLDLSDAGTLRTQRLNALNRLSELIPIRVQEHPSGAIDVFTGSDFLILGGYSQRLEAVVAPTDNGVAEVSVQLTQTHAEIGPDGGEIGGLIESRDTILTGFLDQLDQFIGSTINEFNRIHSSGEGLVGFQDVTSSNFVSDTTAALNAAGLSFSPVHGSFQVKIVNQGTGVREVSNIPIDLDGLGADTSLEDLRAALDGVNHLNATITGDGKLRITTDSGYEVRFGNDTSGVLASLGINTFFTGDSSDNIAINPIIAKDQRYFAAGRGGGSSDNSNALALATFIDNPLKSLQGLSIDNFYTNLISNVAQSASAEKALTDGTQSFQQSLQTQRQEFSGVSIDEEAINVLQLQRNYQAAARIVSTIDELLGVLLQI